MTDPNSAPDEVVIRREFDAPVGVIWRMWTDPEHFQVWFGPSGASVFVAEMDVRVGGPRLVRMTVQAPNGPMEMWFAGEFLEVVENERLVYTEFISDEHGDPLAAAANAQLDGHPTTTRIHVELSETAGRTSMVMTHVGVPADSPGAAGWAMAFDELAALVRAQTTR
jgi:uncharacterized protein YndB with AHSA1/START domain